RRDHRRRAGHLDPRHDRRPGHAPGAPGHRPQAAHARARAGAPREGRLVMLGFMLSEAVRDLRRAGRVAVSAVVLITFSLVALGGFWVLSANLGQAVAQWRDRVRIIVYLKREPAPAEAPALLGRVRALGGIVS